MINGDSLHVPTIYPSEEYVTLKGNIKSPGRYPFQDGMTLASLLAIDGSFNDPIFKKTIDLKSISIFRRKDNSKEIEKLNIDLSNYNKDIKLQNFDQISIPPNKFFMPLKSVIITGEVLFPGLYNVNNQKTLNEIIKTSGGFTQHALKNGIEVFRDSLMIAWEDMNFILDDNDSLNVLRKTGTIKVLGEVHNPGFITFNKSYNVKNYINLAGGFSPFANPKDIMVVEPNGKAIPRKKIGWQSVPEGAIIIVHKRSLLGSARDRASFSMVTDQVGNIATTLLTLMILMNQASNSNGG